MTRDASCCLAATLIFSNTAVGEAFYSSIIFRENIVTKRKDVICRDCRIRVHLEKLFVVQLFKCYMESETSLPYSQESTTPPSLEPV